MRMVVMFGVGRAVRSLVLVLGCLLCAPLASARAADAAPSGPVELTLLHTGDLAGELAALACEGTAPLPTSGATLADAAAAVRVAREEAAAAGRPAPIVVDSGDLLGKAPFLRYALEEGGEGRALLVELVRSMGYDALALGNGELSPPLVRLRPLLESLADAGTRFGAVNVTCDPAVSTLCPYLQTGPAAATVVERAGVRVALLPVVTPQIAQWVDPPRIAGLAVGEPGPAVTAALAALRSAGRIDVVVLIAHVESGRSAPQGALALARAVPDAHLVVANGFARGREARSSIAAVALGDGRTLVVGTPAGPDAIGNVTITVADGRVVARAEAPLPARRAPPDDPAVAAIARLAARYCEGWGQPLGHARVAEPLSDEGFVTLVLEVMRRTHDAPIALLNRGAVGLDEGATFTGPISRDGLFRLLPYDDRLVVATVRGDTLSSILNAALPPNAPAYDEGMRILGAVRDGDSFRVNGRRLEGSRRYRLVSTSFVAGGGDGLLPWLPAPSDWEPVRRPGAPSGRLRGAVEVYFTRDVQRAAGGDDDVALASTFPSLWLRPQWTFSGSLNGTFANVALRGQSRYDQAQLQREETLSANADAKARVEFDTRDHAWTTELGLLYGGARTDGDEVSETTDLVTGYTAYHWTWLRNRTGVPQIYMPVPYGRLGLETEMTIPEERDERHLESTVDVGLELMLTDTFAVSAGYGFRRELLQSDRFHHGVLLRYEVPRTEVFWLFSAPVFVESRCELFVSDIGAAEVFRATAMNRLAFTVFGPLALTVQHDLFLYRVGDAKLGVSSDTQIGLQLYLDTLIQTF